MGDLKRLVLENIRYVDQGAGIVSGLTDEIYARNGHRYFKSGIGRHFRHILDFYGCFFDGLDGLDGTAARIDYDARRRDPGIEKDRHVAQKMVADITERLRTLGERGAPCADVHVCSREGCADACSPGWVSSTPVRELQFLVGHTIHHYAVMAILLSLQGVEPPAEFGFAPSTLAHEKSQAD